MVSAISQFAVHIGGYALYKSKRYLLTYLSYSSVLVVLQVAVCGHAKQT